MNILSLPMMAVSSEQGWPELEKRPPSLPLLLGLLILPLSLLPPAMLYYAGSHYGDAFAAGFGAKPWGSIAVLFFVAEVLTVAAMAWLVAQVTRTHGIHASAYDALLIAALAPIPLWLSSLGLLLPSFAANAGISFLALGVTCSLVYHGVLALCHLREAVTAAAITQTVMGAGLIAWALLLLGIVVA